MGTQKFFLSKEEIRELHRVLDYHRDCGQISLEFAQTGIGIATVIHCEACDQEWNITDYSTW